MCVRVVDYLVGSGAGHDEMAERGKAKDMSTLLLQGWTMRELSCPFGCYVRAMRDVKDAGERRWFRGRRGRGERDDADGGTRGHVRCLCAHVLATENVPHLSMC